MEDIKKFNTAKFISFVKMFINNTIGSFLWLNTKIFLMPHFFDRKETTLSLKGRGTRLFD